MINELAGILLSENFEGRYVELLEALGIKRSDTDEEIPVSMAGENSSCTSIGCFNNSTLVIDLFRSYDCSHKPDKLTPFDRRLLALSKNGLVISFYMQDTSGTYGFSAFKDNERVRCYLSVLGDLIADAGNLFSSEKEFQQAGQQEDRIFAITKEILIKGLDEIIDEGSLLMKLYC